MSVIAKMNVLSSRAFGEGNLLELQCVCENDMMAAYAGSEEDRLFTKYSPSGDARVTVPPQNRDLMVQDKVFVVAAREAEQASFSGAVILVPARCVSLTDFGSESRQVEFALGWRKPDWEDRHALAFNWRMMVDNPGASNQFVPGTDDWWIGIYPAGRFNRDEAIAAAHAG